MSPDTKTLSKDANNDVLDNDLAGVGTAGIDSEIGSHYQTINQNGSAVEKLEENMPGEGATVMNESGRGIAREYASHVREAQAETEDIVDSIEKRVAGK